MLWAFPQPLFFVVQHVLILRVMKKSLLVCKVMTQVVIANYPWRNWRGNAWRPSEHCLGYFSGRCKSKTWSDVLQIQKKKAKVIIFGLIHCVLKLKKMSHFSTFASEASNIFFKVQTLKYWARFARKKVVKWDLWLIFKQCVLFRIYLGLFITKLM